MNKGNLKNFWNCIHLEEEEEEEEEEEWKISKFVDAGSNNWNDREMKWIDKNNGEEK